MIVKNFLDFCKTHSLTVGTAGRDWYRATVHQDYLCAIINGEKDFAAIKPLLDSGDAYLTSAQKKDGQQWFDHSGKTGLVADDAQGVAIEMAQEFELFLESRDLIHHYSPYRIASRDKSVAENPRLEGESEDDYFERLEELQEYAPPPDYVDEAGYWTENGELLLSEKELKRGLWSYRYDNWEESVILVLNETEEDEDDEE